MNNKNTQYRILLFFIFSAFLLFALFDKKILHANNKVKLYFFWGKGCPHCAHEEIFLEQLKKKYPQLEIKSYEVWYNKENAKLFSQIAEAYRTRPEAVPTTLIGDFKPVVGYHNYEITEPGLLKQVRSIK